jgi:hypothetical protein
LTETVLTETTPNATAALRSVQAPSRECANSESLI